MSASRRRGCDALTHALARAGVRRLFTLSGNHVMPIFDATLDAGIALLHTRHEAAAVHMADAWSRLTGEVGVALVTGGPGHANAVSALYTAQMAEAPIVLLSGSASNAQQGLGAFQEMRQAEMAALVTKAAWTCRAAGQVGADIAKAIRLARSGRPGPVNLSLPVNTLEEVATSADPDDAAFDAEPMPLDRTTAVQLMERLVRAERPLILAGPASMTRSGSALRAALEAASGVPVVGMESPRGINDPSLGTFASALARADCVLLVGKRLDFTLGFGRPSTLAAAAEVHQIDADRAEIERSRRALGDRLQITATAAASAALATLAEAGIGGASRVWLDEVLEAVAWRPPVWASALFHAPTCWPTAKPGCCASWS